MADGPADSASTATQGGPAAIPVMTRFLASKSGVMNGVVDNVWRSLKRDHRKLFWTCRTGENESEDSENGGGESLRSWMFEKADGSFTRAGHTLFWYGISNITEVEAAVRHFEKEGIIPRGYLPVSPSAASSSAAAGGKAGVPGGPRGYSTWNAGLKPGLGLGQRRGYATAVHEGQANAQAHIPPVTTPSKKKLGLIGARGYTGQALVGLLNQHPYLELSRVSSRALVGRSMDGYTVGGGLKYENLTPADVQTIEQEGQVDAWVMALPNGGCAPFVNAVDQAQSKKSGKSSVIVDLSADYRFQCGEDVQPGVTRWTYGLPGERV